MEPLTGLLNWILYELKRSNLTSLALLCCPEVFTSCVLTVLGIGKQRQTVQGWGERPPADVWVRAAMKQLPPGNHLLNEGQTWDWISHDPCPHLIIQDWDIRTYYLSLSPGVPREACRDPQDRDLLYNLQWSPFTITAFVYGVKHPLFGKSHSQNSSSCFSVHGQQLMQKAKEQGH